MKKLGAHARQPYPRHERTAQMLSIIRETLRRYRIRRRLHYYTS